MLRNCGWTAALSGLALSSSVLGQVVGGPHAANNLVPFAGSQSAVTHQVFRSSLFPSPVRISSLAYAPGVNGSYSADVAIRMGYTDRVPNLPSNLGGLSNPTGLLGLPNARGFLSTFFQSTNYQAVFTGASPSVFQMEFNSPHGFVYFPGLGNLLVEHEVETGSTIDLSVSRADPNINTSRAVDSSRFPLGPGPLGGLRTEFDLQFVTPTVLPTWPPLAAHPGPIWSDSTMTHHQVFAAPTLTPMSSGGKLAIQALRHAPTRNGVIDGSWRVRMGYTDRVAGFAPPEGLSVPIPGSSAPNAQGILRTFMDRQNFSRVLTGASHDNFSLELRGRPFVYDPAMGNLFVEYVANFSPQSDDMWLSTATSSLESTRAIVRESSSGTVAEVTNIRGLRTEFVATPAAEEIKPGAAHSTYSLIPFGRNQTAILHQVFSPSQFGSEPVRIHSVAFAPNVSGQYVGDVTIRMGYTDRQPGQSGPVGLSMPDFAGGGTPNAEGPMTVFRSGTFVDWFSAPGPDEFQMVFVGDDTFRYNPALGNLLVEVRAVTGDTAEDVGVSRSAGGPQASRSYRSTRFSDGEAPNQATRMRLVYFADQLPCDADLNADGVVDFNDLLAFLNLYNVDNPLVDFNDDGVLDFNDLLQYLNLYNAPC